MLSVLAIFYLSDIEYSKSYAKLAESAKTLASQQVTKRLTELVVYRFYVREEFQKNV